jgi:hypothetical protein
MRYSASFVALGLGVLAATPSFALTVQAGPQRPDVAQHLRPTTQSSSVLPAPGDLKDSYAASGRPQLGQGFYGSTTTGTTSFSFGPVQGATTVTPGYGASWSDRTVHDSGDPLLIVPRRR